MARFCSLPEAVRARDAANEASAGRLKRARRSRVQDGTPTASDVTARLPFCDCRGDTTVNGAASAVHGLRLGRAVRVLVTMNPARSGQTGEEGTMRDGPLAGRVAVVSGGGRGS